MKTLERITNRNIPIEQWLFLSVKPTVLVRGYHQESSLSSTQAEQEIIKLAEIGQRMQWISVDDRLPECSNEVDVWVRTSLGDEQRIPNLKFIKDHWENYYDEIDRFEPLNSFYTVTHWMPLPEKPNRED